MTEGARKPEIEMAVREINGLAFNLLKFRTLQQGGEW